MRWKETAKKLGRPVNRMRRRLYGNLRKAERQRGNWEIQRRVRLQLGADGYSKVTAARVAFLPNEIAAADWSDSGYVLEKIFSALRIIPEPFNPWRTYDLIVNWQDLTHSVLDSSAYVEASYAYTKTNLLDSCVKLNFRCMDISKRRIGQLNSSVLGYDLDVDPTTYSGTVVCKSDENAAHDGVIISCPIAKEMVSAGKVYNVAINNIVDDEAVDFRVPYMRGFAGFFYDKRRSVSSRFRNQNTSVELRNLADEFTEKELSSIAELCQGLGADYGELDVLRDRTNGKIYVVDFAKTPAGPPNGLSAGDVKRAIELMAVAFARNVILDR